MTECPECKSKDVFRNTCYDCGYKEPELLDKLNEEIEKMVRKND